MDHQLSQLSDGQYTCALCQRTWRTMPRSPCVGVPCYKYGCWPQHLYIATQLRRMRLKPDEQPDGYYPLIKAPYHRFLYDINKATPRRVPTERQREAIAKMRVALVETYTCQGCGFSDASHGRSRFVGFTTVPAPFSLARRSYRAKVMGEREEKRWETEKTFHSKILSSIFSHSTVARKQFMKYFCFLSSKMEVIGSEMSHDVR